MAEPTVWETDIAMVWRADLPEDAGFGARLVEGRSPGETPCTVPIQLGAKAGGGPPAWAQGPSLPCFPAGRPVSVLSSSSLRLLPCWHRRLPLSRKSLYKTSLPPDAGFLGPCLGKP